MSRAEITRIVPQFNSFAKRSATLRDAWLDPPDLPDKELQKRTLTNLYNARPDWLAAAHRRLDAAVCAAYGWLGAAGTRVQSIVPDIATMEDVFMTMADT